MGTVIIVLLIGAFLWWSLVPAKPKQPTLHDILNDTDKRQGNFMNVYKHKYTGVYYADKTPINSDDKRVFSGTKTACESYVTKHTNNYL